MFDKLQFVEAFSSAVNDNRQFVGRILE